MSENIKKWQERTQAKCGPFAEAARDIEIADLRTALAQRAKPVTGSIDTPRFAYLLDNYDRAAAPEPVQAVGQQADEAQGAVAYADPMAFTNFKSGTVTKEWMWAKPDAGLVPLYTHAQPTAEVKRGNRIATAEEIDASEAAREVETARLAKQYIDRTTQPTAEEVTVKINRNRVWIVKGVQSFMLAYEADTDEELNWYADKVRAALSGDASEVVGCAFSVHPNMCGCHPEPCCCDAWAVHAPDGKRHSTYGSKESAEEMAALLSPKSVAAPSFNQSEFATMVEKGTKAWDGVPGDFVEELRGRGTEPARYKLSDTEKAALVEAAKTGALVAEMDGGGIMFINRGEQPGDYDFPTCPTCNGSGHADDAALAAAPTLG